MDSDPVALVRRFYQHLESGEVGEVFALLHDDFVVTQDPALPWGGTFRGHDGFAEFGVALATGIESAVEIEAIYLAGDRVVQFGRTRGTVRSNGAQFDIPECHIWTVVGDRAAAADFYIDTAAMLAVLSE